MTLMLKTLRNLPDLLNEFSGASGSPLLYSLLIPKSESNRRAALRKGHYPRSWRDLPGDRQANKSPAP